MEFKGKLLNYVITSLFKINVTSIILQVFERRSSPVVSSYMSICGGFFKDFGIQKFLTFLLMGPHDLWLLSLFYDESDREQGWDNGDHRHW